ncbi:MAG: tyrosine-type recombinase/integrase [bacterium]|nr:tyrosine-type recombinase/integrase [bacterium]
MRNALNQMARILADDPETDGSRYPWHRITIEQISRVRNVLEAKYAPATGQKMIAALKGVLRSAWKRNLVSDARYHRLRDIDAIKGDHELPGRRLRAAEISALLGVCRLDVRAIGRRDAAIIALLASAGLRRAELVELHPEGLELNPQEEDDYSAPIGPGVRVIGKGRRKRWLPLRPEVIPILEAWLCLRAGLSDELPLFLGCSTDGGVRAKPMSGQAVLNAIQRRAEKAGLDHVSPHDFRRTFISNLFSAGIDLADVKRLAGHSQLKTTVDYDRRGMRASRVAINRLIPVFDEGE